MCCDDCEQCVLITVLVQTIIVAIGSLIMTIYGGVLWAQNVDGSDQVFAFLVSLPLTPSVERPRDIYFVSNQTNQSISIQNNFSIMMPTITDSRLFSFYLVHNMFGYHLNITLHGAAEYEYELDFNTDSDNLSTVEYKTITECEVSTRNIQTYEDYTKIWCPSSSYISEYYGINERCKTGSYPMKMDGKYTLSRVGSGLISTSQAYLNFVNSTFIPNNYVDMPQVFFGATTSQGTSSKVGKILTIVGIVLFVLMLIEFFIWFIVLMVCLI